MTESITPSSLAELSSAALTHRLGELFGEERRCLVDFLWHLAEMDRRHGFVALGYGSTFAWCTEALKLPAGSAWRRTTSARLLLRFPIIDTYLRDGRLCMSTLVALREVLDDGNHLELLERASGRTEEEVKVLAATIRPRPEVRESIRPVQTRTVAVLQESSLFTSAPAAASGGEGPAETPAPVSGRERKVDIPVVLVPMPPPPPRIEPIDAQRHSVRLTVGPEFMALLADVKSALSHLVPDGNLEEILRLSMQKTLEVTARRQRAAVEKPVAEKPAPKPCTTPKKWTRYVSAAVRRAVWKRDGGCCTFVGPDGRRCGSRYKLQLDHLKPFAWGGEPTVENLTVRCAEHNLHRAREHFGPRHMAKFSRRRATPAAAPPPVPEGSSPPLGAGAEAGRTRRP